MLEIIKVLLKMQNITLRETAELIYTHRDEKKPANFSSFKVKVSNLSLYSRVVELSKSDIRLEYYLVSKGEVAEFCGNVRLNDVISVLNPEKNIPGVVKRGGFQFQLKDGESNKDLMHALSLASKRSKFVFFRITGLPSANPDQAPTTAECLSVYGRKYCTSLKIKVLVTQNAEGYNCPGADYEAPLQQINVTRNRVAKKQKNRNRKIKYMNKHKQKTSPETQIVVAVNSEPFVNSGISGSDDNSEPPENTVNTKVTNNLEANTGTNPPTEPNFWKKYRKYLIVLCLAIFGIPLTWWVLSLEKL